ncbi:MAG: hypothetical protein ACW987_18375 [Candidatus Thorarchaeota archaeon]|jgi:hypothetical protein
MTKEDILNFLAPFSNDVEVALESYDGLPKGGKLEAIPIKMKYVVDSSGGKVYIMREIKNV